MPMLRYFMTCWEITVKRMVFFLISLVLNVGVAQDLQLYQIDTERSNPALSIDDKTLKGADTESGKKISKGLSLKADVFANEGYSEAELETGNANLNEIEAPMSRYGVGIEINYAIKSNSRLKLEIFFLRALELNTQRKGGKVKAYDNGIRYEENAYDYGDKTMYSAWANSIGVALTLLRKHHLMLTLKQTQLASSGTSLGFSNTFSNKIGLSGFDSSIAGSIWGGNVMNPWAATTQIFLTYSYVF